MSPILSTHPMPTVQCSEFGTRHMKLGLNQYVAPGETIVSTRPVRVEINGMSFIGGRPSSESGSGASDGGSMYLEAGTKLKTQQVSFRDNGAPGGDGGTIVSFAGSEIHLYETSIQGSEASGVGGALHVVDGTVIMENTSITECTAAQGGGGVSIEANSDPIVVHATDTNISKCTTAGKGGALAVRGDFNVLVYDIIMEENEASHGGAVHVADQSSFGCARCIVRANQVLEDGGGLYIGVESTAHFRGTLVVGNSAEQRGGGLYLERSRGIGVGPAFIDPGQ